MGCKVVGMAVNDYRSADNVVCGEALVIEGKPGITFVSKKGKQVACMVRMRLAGWIVVVPCFGEVIRTPYPGDRYHGGGTGEDP